MAIHARWLSKVWGGAKRLAATAGLAWLLTPGVVRADDVRFQFGAGPGPIHVQQVVHSNLGGLTGPACEAPCLPAAPGAVSPMDSNLPPDSTMQPPTAQPAAPSDLQLASNVGGSRGGSSVAQGMIGDFFGRGLMIFSSMSSQHNAVPLPIGAGDRVNKIAENSSPIPTDRVIFNYHNFNNSLTTADGRLLDLQRYLFGVEKTFLDGAVSVEVRVPFATGLNNDQGALDSCNTNGGATQFGNMGLNFKALLYQQGAWSLGGDLAFTLPTADDARLFQDTLPGSQLIATVRNEAVYVQPFIGAQFAPNDRLWMTFFTQLSFDANGNPVTFANASQSGVLQEQNLLFCDVSMGYWLYRNPNGFIAGVAPMVEMHYTTTMNDGDRFEPTPGDVIENPYNRMDILNCTGGLRVLLGSSSYVNIAGVAPLRTRNGDKTFDSEVAVQFVRGY